MREGDGPTTAEVRSAVERIRAGGRALVAMSGGVDSGLVASLAREALGAEVLAVTLVSPAVSRAEIERADAVARSVGVDHRRIPVDPLARPEYRANPPNRCYFCRRVEADALLRIGSSFGARQYLDGIHRDDMADERPGIRAMEEAGFRHPLFDAGWGKAAVRSLARQRGLPNWDAPSDACLASRIRHGQPVDRETLVRIETAEALVRSAGFRQVRVRVAGSSARIEVDPGAVLRLASPDVAEPIVRSLRNLGFREVTIDPAGYRSHGAGA
ncbi:MAG: ATP-dependent sacrificial sulfur transferase LarE [Thermoplasmata archaeon]